MSLRLVCGVDQDLLRDKVSLRALADPHHLRSVAEEEYAALLDPAGVSLVAYDGEVAVGAGEVCRMAISPESYARLFAAVWTLPAARRRGVGSAILVALAEHARARGKSGLEGECVTDDPAGLAFASAHGLHEDWREHVLLLPLAGRTPEAVTLTPGVELVDGAADERLLREAHAVAVEALADVPAGSMPMSAGDFAHWRSLWIDSPAVENGQVLFALDDGKVAGFAILACPPGRPGVGHHAITAVARAARGKGIAKALKQRQVRYAIERGLTTLETHNEATNEPMLAVNRAFGYVQSVDVVGVVGPLPISK